MCYLCLRTAQGTTYVEQLVLAATPDHPVHMTEIQDFGVERWVPRDKISIECACYRSGVPTMLLSAGVAGVEVDEIVLETCTAARVGCRP